MKKALSLILAMLMVLSTMSCLTVVSLGADVLVTEVEPNDTEEGATEIEANELQTGIISDKTGTDWYKFTNDKDYFTVSFKKNAVHTGDSPYVEGWNVEIYRELPDGKMSLLVARNNILGFDTVKLPYTGTMYIKVQLRQYQGTIWDAQLNKYYDILVETTEDALFEDEDNDLQFDATEIESGKTCTGIINFKEGEDWYKFTNDKDYFTVSFKKNAVHTGDSPYVEGWDVEIYRELPDGKLSLLVAKNNILGFDTVKLPYTGTMYIKVQLRQYQGTIWDDQLNKYYDILVETTEDALFEDEDNDLQFDATEIESGKTCTGIINLKEGEDWYKFTNDKDYFTVSFKKNAVHTGDSPYVEGWNVEIYRELSNGELSLLVSKNSTLGFDTVKLPYTGTIYVRVKLTKYSENVCEDQLNKYYDILVETTEDALFENEDNDRLSDAIEVESGKTYTGIINLKECEDWYKFTNDKDYFTVSFKKNAVHTGDSTYVEGWNVEIYRELSDGELSLLVSENSTLGFDTVKLPYTGTIYVRVKLTKYSEDICEDQLNKYYDIKADVVENGRWESEDNNEQKDANKIKQGLVYKGTLMSESDADYYKFTSTSSAFKIKFNLNAEEMDPDCIRYGWNVKVYSAEDPTIVLYNKVVNTMAGLESIVLPYGKGKNFVVKISAGYATSSRVPIDQTYNFSIVDAAGGKKWELENNKSSLTNATKVNIGDKVYGNFYDENDKDYFKVYIPASGKITVKFNRTLSENTGSGWKLVLQDAAGSELESVDLGNSLNAKFTSKTVKKSGYYYLRLESVNSRSAPGSDINYNLTFSYTMTAPKLSSVANATNGITLKWTKVEDCVGYYVYRKAGNGSWKKIATVKGEGKLTYTDKTAKNGTKYTYKVKAYDGKLQSAYSSSKTITFISAPKAKSVTSSRSGVTFTWNKVTGATGYEVYRATGNGSYKKIVTVKKGSVVKFVDKSAKKGKTYKYKVRAVKGSAKSAFSGVKTIKDKY